jgi:hypothetical protein
MRCDINNPDRYNGSLLLVDIEIESLSRKHPLKQRF